MKKFLNVLIKEITKERENINNSWKDGINTQEEKITNDILFSIENILKRILEND